MPRPHLSPQEAVDTLKRSSLPTIITEGSDDYIVFRRLELSLADKGVSVMPVGGRSTVLEIYKRRNEFSHIQSAFIVDSDLWLFLGVPAEFNGQSGLIMTDGYSIENDLLRDGNIEDLLFAAEIQNYRDDLNPLCEWFAFAVSQVLQGGSAQIALHIDQIVPRGAKCLSHKLRTDIGYTDPPQSLETQIKADYKKYLRGKTLLSLLHRYLSYPGRSVSHKPKSLLEMAAVRDGQHMARIRTQLEGIFV